MLLFWRRLLAALQPSVTGLAAKRGLLRALQLQPFSLQTPSSRLPSTARLCPALAGFPRNLQRERREIAQGKKTQTLLFWVFPAFKTHPAVAAGPPMFPAGFSAWLAHVFDGCDKTDSLDSPAGLNPAQDSFPPVLPLFQAV